MSFRRRFRRVSRVRGLSFDAGGRLQGGFPQPSRASPFPRAYAERYWSTRSIMEGFDGLIHFETTRPTTVLPFRYPSSF